MHLTLGLKIRELRRRDGRTQEALAEALGVTSQAVSRWESGGSYPDMEMIPSIANYFGITIDELFGYNNDREMKIKAITDKAEKEIHSIGNHLAKGHGDLTNCVDMLRAGAKEFPNEPLILLQLGESLHILGWQKYGAKVVKNEESDYICEDIEYNSKNIYWQEALEVFEKLLKLDIPAEYREPTVFMAIKLYHLTGNYKRATTLAMEQSSLLRSREVLLPMATVGEEKERYQGELLLALLSQFHSILLDVFTSNTSFASGDDGKNTLLALASLYENIFTDGKLGPKHRELRYIYLLLAEQEARQNDNLKQALVYFDKAFEQHKAYCRICSLGDYHYSSPLVSKVTIPAKQFPVVPENYWKTEIECFPENLCKELRKCEKYKECFE